MQRTTIPTPVQQSNDGELLGGIPQHALVIGRPLGASPTMSENPSMKTAPSTADDVASYVGRKTESAVASVGRKIEESAPSMGGKAEDAIAYVGHKAEDAASYAGAGMGSGLRSLGDKVRELGPESGIAGDANSAIAGTLERGGRYLQDENVEKMAADVTDLIRRNPIPSLLIGIAAGYFIGRTTSSRS